MYIRRRDKTADRELVERSFAVHLFKEHLFKECTYSKRTYKRNVRLQRWNTSRNGGEQISAELTSHTSPFCNDYNKLQSFAFWSLCSFFPHAKNCAYLSYSHSSSLVFDVREPLCVWYERLRRVVAELAHKAWWHNKGTILIYASADFPSSSDV